MKKHLSPPHILWLAVALGGCAREPAPTAPDFQRAASLQEIMLLHIDPAVDPLWQSVGTVETAAGIDTRSPANDEEWAEQRANALRLIETGNLLLIPGRRAVAASSTVPGAHIDGVLDHAEVEAAVRREWPRFVTYATELQTAARAALVATEARDAHALLVAGEQLQEACEQCHGQFWYPGDKPPADPAAADVKPLEDL